MLKKVGKTKDKFGAAEKAEAKLLAVLVYFIIITILSLASDSFSASVTPRLYLNALFPYFTCESQGRDDSGECQALLAQVQQRDLFNASIALTVMIGFLPFVVFIFSTDFKVYAMLFQRMHRKIFSRTTESIVLPHTGHS